MKVVSTRRPEGWIELTPLIDVLFILLVFVLLTTSFANQRSMSVTLPEAVNTRATNQHVLEVTIARDGGVWIADSKVADQHIDASLLSMRQDHDSILLRADAEGSLKHTVSVIDRARTAGFQAVSIATRSSRRAKQAGKSEAGR
jgi:biopolymer transport protein ExbD